MENHANSNEDSSEDLKTEHLLQRLSMKPNINFDVSSSNEDFFNNKTFVRKSQSNNQEVLKFNNNEFINNIEKPKSNLKTKQQNSLNLISNLIQKDDDYLENNKSLINKISDIKKKKNVKKKLTFNINNNDEYYSPDGNQNCNNIYSNGLDNSLLNDSYANFESENEQPNKNIADESFLSQNLSINEDEEAAINFNSKLVNKNINYSLNENRIDRNEDRQIGEFNQNYILSDEGYGNNVDFKFTKGEENVFEEFKNFRKNQSLNNSRIKSESRKSSINGNKKKSNKIQTNNDNHCFRSSNNEGNNEEPFENMNFANIKYSECKSDTLSYMIYERLFKNNYIYFPESNEYYLTSQEENLKSVHILVEENLRKTLKNYIICLIPFDQISNINLERFYSAEQVEFFNKIKSEVNSNLCDLENLYNLNIENLLKESKNFIDNFYKTFKRNENSKAKFSCKCMNLFKETSLCFENKISDFSIFAQETKYRSSISENKKSFIPPAPKLRLSNLNSISNNISGKKTSLLLDKEKTIKEANNRDNNFHNSNDNNFKVNENSESKNINRNIQSENINNTINIGVDFEIVNNYFKDFFHPRILRANNFLKATKECENTTIVKYNNDNRTKNISNTHLLYSNLAKEFPFEFVLNRKYKTNKKKSEIRIIERENFIIENFHKFQRDVVLPKKLKIKNFGNKIFNFDFVDKKLNQIKLKVFSEANDLNPFFSNVKIDSKKLNLENHHTSVEINMENDEITHKEEIEKMLIETVEKIKRKNESINTTNKKVSDALKLVNLKLPKFDKKYH